MKIIFRDEMIILYSVSSETLLESRYEKTIIKPNNLYEKIQVLILMTIFVYHKLQMDKELEQILKQNELRKTPLRFKILSVLKNASYALSQPEIESKIEEDLDRITVYRTLKSFEEKGIIHRVFDIWGTAKFAFSFTDQTTRSYKEHLHFNCTNCKRVFCLASYSLPSLNFPKGFEPTQINLSAEGLCKECAALKH